MSKINVVDFNADASVLASGMPLLSCQTYPKISTYIFRYAGSFDTTVRLWDLRSVI